MSAIGSVVILFSLPAGFDDAGDFAHQRVAAETNTAHLKLSQIASGAPANTATIAVADLEFGLPFQLCKLTRSSHLVNSP
jgi:hypothetical protein